MKKYSIVQIGSEYIVQAGATSILKVPSRQAAVKLVTAAAELLQQKAGDSSEDDPPSIEREAPELP